MALFKGLRQKPKEDCLPVTERPSIKRQLGYYVANLQGIGARERQEDSFTVAGAFDVAAIREKGLLFAVCDGMGGMKDGKLASETAIQSLRQSFAEMNRDSDLAAQLKESVFLASSRVEAQIGGDGGSTAVIGILYQERLFYASVGDSYLYLLRDGRLLKLNTEHNVCHQKYLEAIRDGDLDPAPLREIPEAAALTQFLGMTGFHDVDGSVRPLPMQEGDVLLACSDGVGGVLHPQEIAKALQGGSVEQMCRTLEEGLVLHNKPNQDNYTAIVVKCVL